MTITVDQAKLLREPFKPEQIGKLPKPTRRENPKGKCAECGGYHGLPAVHLDYVGHAAITDRLLQVDPCWTWRPMGVDEHGLPLLDAKGGLWIWLTVCGETRPGYGDETNGKGMKEIIGDALRNGAMRFGVGLDLWSKEDLHAGAEARGAESGTEAEASHSAQASATVTPPLAAVPGVISDSQRRRLRAIQREHGVTDDRLHALVRHIAGADSSKDIPKSQYDALIAAVELDARPAA